MENEVRKLGLSWWDSKVCSENLEWIAENVKGLDQSVKEMLLLIEHDGEISMEKQISDQPVQPELIDCIKEISHRHHLLADHYNKLTGELKNYEKNSFGPQITHPFITPEKKIGMQNVEGQVVPSELSLSSGGGISDTTPIEGSESSLLSSDSDSESYYSSPGKILKRDIPEMGGIVMAEQEHQYETIKGGGCGDFETLTRRVLGYEKELKVSEEKLQLAEEEIAGLKCQLENNESIIVQMSCIEAQLVSAQNQIKTHEAEMGEENKRSLMLQRQIFDLEAKLESEKRLVQELEEIVKNHTGELLDCDREIEKLNAELQDASAKFAVEKRQFESSVFKLSERLSIHEARTNELQTQRESLEDEKVEMVRKQEALKASWQDNIEHVKVELREKNVIVNSLNENLDKLKLNYDMVMAEKDEENAKLREDLMVRNDEVLCRERELNELRCENESANKVIAELKSRTNELEEEVGIQKVIITDTAEEKREAIRQLCYTLDHFRSAYRELHSALYAFTKRPTAMI